MNNTADRMRLDEVVAYFSTRGYKQTASYFMSMVAIPEESDVILDRNAFWVNTRSVKNHIGDRLYKELQCEVVTWIPE